jgi:hypothetical protein
MSLLEFFLSFLILTVISSGAIVGWYCVTRGEWTMTPDGKWKKTGMIFNFWSLFFEQYRKTQKVYYIGKPFSDKYALVSKIRPDLIPGKYCIDILESDRSYLKSPLGKNPVEEKDLNALKDLLLVEIEWDVENDRFRFYQDEPIYDWPQWIQKPLSSCPTCLAGPYGTAIWLVFLKLQRDAFAWTDSPIFAQIAFGMIFLLTLSASNSYLSKKLKL